jgi:serine/threonine protein phosphatase PrpC
MKTRDHSVIQSMVDAGLGDFSSLRHHPYRSVLLSALGGKGGFDTSVASSPLQLVDGDALLMCTDGLWEHVEDVAMERLLAASTSSEAWLTAMESELLMTAESGCDNYTARSVWVSDTAEDTVLHP